jgi:hypothetical protein
LFRLDSVVRWLDAAEARMRRASTQPRVAPAGPPVRVRHRMGVQR